MKKGEIYEGTVKEVIFPNKGIVEIQERPVIVKHTVKGQNVRFQINKVRKGKCEARLLEVLEKAPAEITPPCPHFGICGGCSWQNLPYEEQLKLKAEQVQKLLDEVCQNYIFEGIKPSPRQFAYRNKMEFSFGDEVKDGPLVLGMHKRGSFYDIVTVDQCQIVDSDFRQILSCVLKFSQAQGWTFYHKMRHEGYLRHLLVRKAARTEEILIDLVTSTEKTYESGFQEFVDALLALPLSGKITGILHTANDSLADIIQNDGTKILWGQDYFYEELLGLRFKITPFSFFQTNSLGAEVLYETARSYVGETKDKVIFDLYSGTGTIAQMLAPVAKKVVGVEIVEEAVEAAKTNAKLNGLENCEFLAGDVLKVVDMLEERPDLVVVDPPRDGMHPKALQKIAGSMGAERMVYISCKPTSLARDLVEMQGYGYRVERVCCVDMFPGTSHVETIALLTRETQKLKDLEIEF
ncbi:MAG: 23S rRNA (uracil(1939)-C(5))-methyltransferase RlmD [Eubacteriales bacterium]|nr:23S rRNA (uracil(1939)-C(5))-methyltransferase RlmD [Eubacteriales bacterium]